MAGFEEQSLGQETKRIPVAEVHDGDIRPLYSAHVEDREES